jgi:ADP-ribose pyrophosphatase
MEYDIGKSRYAQLRAARPKLFANPPGAPFEILFDSAQVVEAERQAGIRLADHGLPASWGVTGVVFEDQYSLVLRDAIRWHSGELGTYVRRVNPFGAPGVVILPRCADDLVLVRHFRHSTRRWHLEFPRGFGEAGSTPEQNARRELLEEINGIPKVLRPLGILHPDTGLAADEVHLFYAEIDEYNTGSDENEGITAIDAVSSARLAALIESGEVTDGFTIAAWTRAALMNLVPKS